MQLSRKNIAGLLSVATCSLLAGQARAADEWDVDSAILFYSEPDRVHGRVVFYCHGGLNRE